MYPHDAAFAGATKLLIGASHVLPAGGPPRPHPPIPSPPPHPLPLQPAPHPGLQAKPVSPSCPPPAAFCLSSPPHPQLPCPQLHLSLPLLAERNAPCVLEQRWQRAQPGDTCALCHSWRPALPEGVILRPHLSLRGRLGAAFSCRDTAGSPRTKQPGATVPAPAARRNRGTGGSGEVWQPRGHRAEDVNADSPFMSCVTLVAHPV